MTPRPDCWEFVLDFLGDPEATELDDYVTSLEKRIEELESYLRASNSLFAADPEVEPNQ